MSDIIDLTVDDDSATELESLRDVGNVNDDDDEDLRTAIAMSLQDKGAAQSPDKSSLERLDDNVGPSPPSQGTLAASTSGLASLDRKAMEAERLARLKRKQTTIPTDLPPKRSRISPPPLQRHKFGQNAASSSKSAIPTLSTCDDALSSSKSPSRKYKVLVTSHPSRYLGNGELESVAFPDILKPPKSSGTTLRSVLLSSFVIDFEWLLPHFQTTKVGFVFVLHAHNAAHKIALQNDFANLPNVRLVLPKVMGSGGSMHSKTMLLFFEGAGQQVCRIVIPSANLVPSDWGVGRTMENVLWTVDLPQKSGNIDTESSSSFQDQLCLQLKSMDVPQDVIRKLNDFDFRGVEDCRFIHSCSGSFPIDQSCLEIVRVQENIGQVEKRNSKHRLRQTAISEKADHSETGLLLLCETVRALGLELSPDIGPNLPKVDFITSSLGNLSQDFIQQLVLAISGRKDDLLSTQARKSKRDHTFLAKGPKEELQRILKIYFPSSETVHKSRGGPGNAGTICFQKGWWDTNELIQDHLFDLVNKRDDGMLMHSKILYVRYQRPVRASNRDEECCYAGWAYVGSSNCSESAWGRITSSRKNELKVICRNWESGVLIPVKVATAVSETSRTASLVVNAKGADHDLDFSSLDEVFRDIVPVLMSTPGIQHKSIGTKPWFFSDHT